MRKGFALAPLSVQTEFMALGLMFCLASHMLETFSLVHYPAGEALNLIARAKAYGQYLMRIHRLFWVLEGVLKPSGWEMMIDMPYLAGLAFEKYGVGLGAWSAQPFERVNSSLGDRIERRTSGHDDFAGPLVKDLIAEQLLVGDLSNDVAEAFREEQAARAQAKSARKGAKSYTKTRFATVLSALPEIPLQHEIALRVSEIGPEVSKSERSIALHILLSAKQDKKTDYLTQ